MFSSRKFGDFISMTVVLNGGILGKNVENGVEGLVGQQISFLRPLFNHTFVQPPGWTKSYLLLRHIKDQIEGADPNISVSAVGNRILFVERVPTQGVALEPAVTEHARVLLGFPVTGPYTGRVIKQKLSADPPRLESIQQTNDGSFLVLIWEG